MSNTNTAGDPNVLVLYARNVDSSTATEAIAFHDDERENLVIGRAGYVSEQELYSASANGIVLQTVTEDELRKLNVPVPKSPEQIAEEKAEADSDGLDDLKVAELESLADKEGVNVEDVKGKEALIQTIRDSRSGALAFGRDTLPATTNKSAPIVESENVIAAENDTATEPPAPSGGGSAGSGSTSSAGSTGATTTGGTSGS